MDLDPELAALRPLGPFFALRTTPGTATTLPALAAAYAPKDPGGLLASRVRTVAHRLRTPEPRVAASITQQGLAARLWSAALGCAVRYGRLPDLHPSLLRWDITASAPDDLGQAAAISRLDRHYRGEPHPFFGFDYLVEADASEALKFVEASPLAAKALLRQADRVLAPFMYRVWVEAGTWRVVTEPPQLEWLNRPYDKVQGDKNYNHQRAGDLFDIFGGADACGESAVDAEGVARQYLVEAIELTAKCQEARDLALQEAAVLSAQAAARRAAGRFVGDVEGLMTDARVLRALADGLAEPSIRVVAAVCIVRRGMMRVSDEH